MANGVEQKVSRFWRLADKLTIVQAALLVIGVEPQGVSDSVERWADGSKPDNYTAVRDSIANAIENSSIKGKLLYQNSEYDQFGACLNEGDDLDFNKSSVEVTSLRNWLAERGFEAEALAKSRDEPQGFRDPKHPRYSNKLAAVVEAWEQFEPDSNEVGTPKQQLMKWLRLNASRFELTDSDGRPSENVIEELAKVANWAKGGGAPKSRDIKPEPE
ncbi:hypothetical protein [Agrobacterium vitis]|uniref:hypothetical protein n=1 Tax=Agrobacterium vitis TaxID=373 RepID=UPI003D2C8205